MSPSAAVHLSLLRRLSPPANRLSAARRLSEIQNRLGQRYFHELVGNQSTKDTRRQLEALRADLGRLKSRAWFSLRRALGVVFLEDPFCRPLADGRDFGWTLQYVIAKALDRAISDLQERRRGNPGKISDGSRQAARELIDLFCECHNMAWPSYDFCAEEVRNPKAVEFAIDCLLIWRTPGATDIEPKSLIRSLQKQFGQILPE